MLGDTNNCNVGVIMSLPRNCYLASYPEEHMYWVYDVFVGNELIIDVPQDFMVRLKEYANEESVK